MHFSRVVLMVDLSEPNSLWFTLESLMGALNSHLQHSIKVEILWSETWVGFTQRGAVWPKNSRQIRFSRSLRLTGFTVEITYAT